MSDVNDTPEVSKPVDPESAPDAAPIPANPNPVAPAEPTPHPTGVILSPDEVQHPDGSVTEEDDIDEEYEDGFVDEDSYPVGEQIEPEDVENGGAA